MSHPPEIPEEYTVLTRTEVADKLGITRQRVAFVERKALRKLRAIIDEDRLLSVLASERLCDDEL